MSRTLLDGQTTTDGRLRELLTDVPARNWLRLFGVRHIITDKVGDLWVDGVFFDRQLPITLEPFRSETISYLPEMSANALWLLSDGDPGTISIKTKAGEQLQISPKRRQDRLWFAQLPHEGGVITSVVLTARSRPWQVEAISLVNEKEGTFYPLVMGPFRLIHSGDVKIYAFADPLPRVVALRTGSNTILDDILPHIKPKIVSYKPEQVIISLETAEPLRLALLEADYPGWEVTVNGQTAKIIAVDGFFRAVDLPAGRHEVVFEFHSRPVRLGQMISVLAFLMWLGVWLGLISSKRLALRPKP
jgi:hypothetical protein